MHSVRLALRTFDVDKVNCDLIHIKKLDEVATLRPTDGQSALDAAIKYTRRINRKYNGSRITLFQLVN